MIYFIQEEHGPIKIGVTSGNPALRLSFLQAANPFKLTLLGFMDGDLQTENALHARFEASRIRGEWFGPVDELLTLIAQHPIPLKELSMKVPKIRLVTQVEPETDKEIERRAKQESRTKSAMTNELLKLALVKSSKHPGKGDGE